MEKNDAKIFKVRGNSVRLNILFTILLFVFLYCYLQFSSKWRYAFLFAEIIVLMQLLIKPITYRISKNHSLDTYYFWGRCKSESIDINSITSIS